MHQSRTAAPSLDSLHRRFRDAHNRRALDELRHQVAAAIRQAADEADDSDGDLSNEAQQLFDALKQLLSEIDAKVSRQAVIDDLDVRSARPRDRADRAYDAGLPEFSLRGMIASAIGHPIPGLDLGRSIEISQELRQRTPLAPLGFWAPLQALYLTRDYTRKLERRDTISTTLPAGGPGGSLIPLTLDAARYIDALRARTIVIQAGAQTINDRARDFERPNHSESTGAGAPLRYQHLWAKEFHTAIEEIPMPPVPQISPFLNTPRPVPTSRKTAKRAGTCQEPQYPHKMLNSSP
jgi:hypothetical protein